MVVIGPVFVFLELAVALFVCCFSSMYVCIVSFALFFYFFSKTTTRTFVAQLGLCGFDAGILVES